MYLEPSKLSLDMSNLHGRAARRVVLQSSFAQHFPMDLRWSIINNHFSKVDSNDAFSMRGAQKRRHLKNALPIGTATKTWNERRLCLLTVVCWRKKCYWKNDLARTDPKSRYTSSKWIKKQQKDQEKKVYILAAHREGYRVHSLKRTNRSWKVGYPKRKRVFEPSIFRCYVSFKGVKTLHMGIVWLTL